MSRDSYHSLLPVWTTILAIVVLIFDKVPSTLSFECQDNTNLPTHNVCDDVTTHVKSGLLLIGGTEKTSCVCTVKPLVPGDTAVQLLMAPERPEARWTRACNMKIWMYRHRPQHRGTVCPNIQRPLNYPINTANPVSLKFGFDTDRNQTAYCLQYNFEFLVDGDVEILCNKGTQTTTTVSTTPTTTVVNTTTVPTTTSSVTLSQNSTTTTTLTTASTNTTTEVSTKRPVTTETNITTTTTTISPTTYINTTTKPPPTTTTTTTPPPTTTTTTTTLNPTNATTTLHTTKPQPETSIKVINIDIINITESRQNTTKQPDTTSNTIIDIDSVNLTENSPNTTTLESETMPKKTTGTKSDMNITFSTSPLMINYTTLPIKIIETIMNTTKLSEVTIIKDHTTKSTNASDVVIMAQSKKTLKEENTTQTTTRKSSIFRNRTLSTTSLPPSELNTTKSSQENTTKSSQENITNIVLDNKTTRQATTSTTPHPKTTTLTTSTESTKINKITAQLQEVLTKKPITRRVIFINDIPEVTSKFVDKIADNNVDIEINTVATTAKRDNVNSEKQSTRSMTKSQGKVQPEVGKSKDSGRGYIVSDPIDPVETKTHGPSRNSTVVRATPLYETKGFIIGMAVGCAIVVIIIIVMACIYCRYRSHHKDGVALTDYIESTQTKQRSNEVAAEGSTTGAISPYKQNGIHYPQPIHTASQNGIDFTTSQNGIDRTTSQNGIDRTTSQNGIDRTISQISIDHSPVPKSPSYPVNMTSTELKSLRRRQSDAGSMASYPGTHSSSNSELKAPFILVPAGQGNLSPAQGHLPLQGHVIPVGQGHKEKRLTFLEVDVCQTEDGSLRVKVRGAAMANGAPTIGYVD